MNEFHHLVRFESKEGHIFIGDITEDVSHLESLVGVEAEVFEGTSPWDSGFRKVLAPLPSVPIFPCVGLNYQHHAAEVNVDIPSTPPLFYKPPDALAGPDEDIHVHPTARCLDYEGELCIVIGRDCKNLAEDDNPLDYVFGYTVGNDISSRYWQAPAISSNQAGYAKGFDQFAPIGPVITSSRLLPDLSCLMLTTHVNGEERQRHRLDDMIFDVPAIIRFISTGRTIKQGTVIMTGTPSGVIAGMRDKVWLKNGDTVEVTIEKVGRIKNRMVMEEGRDGP
ncbi:uncharacterized protein N7496_001523 [Penicillium cataractarum]|uniref:Fumarylacetoacetase-like C-terminal domain-containing protein n=1 Tax=Penicillium cataractarum TaxID=2100454 RepID=A0A9X0B706_9EURO|nr:uncharacterized protein N7496_001523 [Penicillium cataractarum]KAJ5390455.1 hypothetical protein N7496_001523 [Penicillium cataractarum]